MNKGVRIGKHLFDTFHIQNSQKHGDALKPLFFNFALEYSITKVQKNQVRLKLNGIHQPLVDVDDVNLLVDSTDSVKKSLNRRE
jgi:hypothetical protein